MLPRHLLTMVRMPPRHAFIRIRILNSETLGNLQR